MSAARYEKQLNSDTYTPAPDEWDFFTVSHNVGTLQRAEKAQRSPKSVDEWAATIVRFILATGALQLISGSHHRKEMPKNRARVA